MFEVGDLIAQRYQLQQLLGQRGAGRQTWRVSDRAQESWGQGVWRSLQKLPWLQVLTAPTPEPQAVIKFLAFNPQMTWDEFKLFEREAQILQQIDHPRIPRYQHSFELAPHRNAPYHWFALVQDYIPGQSLQDLLDQGDRFSEADIYGIAAQVLEILSYLHGCSPPILHRDIKPSNLIWGRDRQIYLVDFGAVKTQEPLIGASLTVVGTSGYTPMEQFWGQSSPASDLFALGATLIHLLTGIAPAHLPQRELKWQFADKIKINPRLLRWLHRMTAASPEKRFASAQQALAALNGDRYGGSSLQPLPVDDWDLSPLTQSSALKPAKTTIRIVQSENYLEIVIPSGKMHVLTRLQRAWQQGLRRQGMGFLSLSSIFRLTGAVGLMLLPLVGTVTLLWLPTRSLSPSLGLGLLAGYGGVLGLGLLLYSLAQFSDRLYLRCDRDHIQIERQIFGQTYSQTTEQLATVLGVFTHPQGDRYQVSLNTEKEVYYLGERLKAQEAHWLAHILQNYLHSS